MNEKKDISPWVRITILILFSLVAIILSKIITGQFLPTDTRSALIFQNALLLIVLGSAIIEHRYTKPADAVVNSLIGMITLLTVKTVAPQKFWWLIFLYSFIVFCVSITCVSVSSSELITNWKRKLANLTYKPSVILGKANLIFSIIFLFGVFSFYKIQSKQSAILVSFWGVYMAIWPLRLPNLLTSIFSKNKFEVESIGSVIRTDWPNIVRASIKANTEWSHDSPKIFQQASGKQFIIVPLYSQFQKDQQIATGICVPYKKESIEGLGKGYLYNIPKNHKLAKVDLTECMKGSQMSDMIGFVVENSTISNIHFETWSLNKCEEGKIVWCNIGENRVYYQITNGITKEESLESDKHGYQVAIASQIGIITSEGFKKFTWLPSMNTPVFIVSEDSGGQINFKKESDFEYGKLPKTSIKISGSFLDSLEHHTAILGITGSGKTELAFDLIRHSASNGVKVICIDLTSRYKGKLEDLAPENLSISETTSEQLSKKLFDVETGEFKASKERKALEEFADQLRGDISGTIEKFLTSKEKNKRVGLINLEEISNTKATLYITELYLTCLLHFAKDNPEKCSRVLVVVEEAHTVMPEPTTMGLGDYESRGLVSKIAQIALQGRKYNVGLLVIAQRTATVSKSVLTQCNTVISFACYDDTSLKFLQNIFGESYTCAIPNLPFLNAVIFGNALKSERPMIVEIPFNESKAKTKK